MIVIRTKIRQLNMALEEKLPSHPGPLSHKSLVHSEPLLPMLLFHQSSHSSLSLSLHLFNSLISCKVSARSSSLWLCSNGAALHINRFWFRTTANKHGLTYIFAWQVCKPPAHLCKETVVATFSSACKSFVTHV